MTVDNAIIQYKKIVHSLNGIRDLLRTILIDTGVSITGQPSLNTLMSKVNPIDINSVVNQKLPNIPIDTTQHFNSQQNIHDYFYTNNEIDFVLSQANLLLIRKFLFYRQYLQYQLKNMGISEYDIKKAQSIKELVLLIKKIERIKKVYILSESNILYIGKDTDIEIDIIDENEDIVDSGIINIYVGSQATGTPYKTYKIGDDFFIKVDSPGQYTYTIEYVNTNLDGSIIYNQYQPTEPITITFDAIYEKLDGTLIAQNMNIQSEYYWENTEEIAGYENDYWDLEIQITNSEGDYINYEIPFDIYMGDDNHFIVSGTTNEAGYAKIYNINIPYCSSDFISFRERAISVFSLMEVYGNNLILSANNNITGTGQEDIILTLQLSDEEENIDADFYINYDDEELLNKLHFIKDPAIENDTITYKRVKYTKENTLNELNGCLTSISLVDGVLQYTTFNTTEETKIKDVNNLKNKLRSLVTEIFYNKQKDIFDYETVELKKYEYEKENNNFVFLILKTNLNQPTYREAEILSQINIYHIPIVIDNNFLTWYKSDPNIPSSIPIQIYDKYTGAPIDHIDDTFYIEINNNCDLVSSSIYNYVINIDNLPYGDNNLNIILKNSSLQIMCKILVIIKILSNFILPEENFYYLNDSPNIYYTPLGSYQKDKEVVLYMPGIQRVLLTNNAGILDSPILKSVGSYNISLRANSDGLTEIVTYQYEIAKPFKIEQISYNKTQSAIYKITIYDNKHINWKTITPNTYITVKNNNNNINYDYTSLYNSNELIYNITIDTIGTNILTVSINGYTETKNIKLYSQLFELQTTTTNLGEQIIQVKTFDDETETISITGDYISSHNPITKTNNILNVPCTISRAGVINLNMTEDNVTESATLQVNKGNINSTLSMDQDNFDEGYNEYVQATWHIDSVPIDETITVIINNANTQTTKYQNIGNSKNENISFKVNNLNPSTYTLSITFMGSTNYNSFVKNITYDINEVYEVLVDMYMSDDILVLDYNMSNINTDVITDITINNEEKMIIQTNTYDYVESAIRHIDFSDGKLIITK